MRNFWLALLSFCPIAVNVLASAQTTSAKSSSEKPLLTTAPMVKLKTATTEQTQIGAAQVLFGPMTCSPDGDLLIKSASPPSLEKTSLMSLSKEHGNYSATYYSLETLSDLFDVTVLGYFANESEVVMLVRATRDSSVSTTKRVTVLSGTGERKEAEVKSGRHSEYIASFDREGNYKGSVELDLPFRARKIAVFDSGQLLLIGPDLDHKTKFAFVNADGSVQRLLDIEDSLAGSEKGLKAAGLQTPPSELAQSASIVGLANIVPFQDKLVLSIEGMTWLLELAPSGEVRRVPIQMPPGEVIQHMIASHKWWYVVPEKSGAGTHFADETIIYEVNPADGSVRQQFDTAPNYAGEIACEHDGEFRGIRYDKKGIIVVTAKP